MSSWSEHVKDCVRGVIVGAAIGDAFGMPFEGRSAAKIREIAGRPVEYCVGDVDHPIEDLRGQPAGVWTDDAQLTRATLRALTKGQGLVMQEIAQEHLEAYKKSTVGWGSSTRRALERLAAGESWEVSGEGRDQPALGNGIAMKAAPFGVMVYLWDPEASEFWTAAGAGFGPSMERFAYMTHASPAAVVSGIVQAAAVWFALRFGLEIRARPFHDYWREQFVATLVSAATDGYCKQSTIADDDTVKRLVRHLDSLRCVNWSVITHDQMRTFFDREKKGSHLIASLPFSYAYALKYLGSFDGVYEVAWAGRDADTNASMVGAIVGGMCGMSKLKAWLVDGLYERDAIIAEADAMIEAFPSEVATP